MSTPMPPLFESTIKSLPLLGRGKVRDIYAVGDDKLLIVTTDRLSAFDVILPDPIPGKGAVLTAVANFWFGKLAHVVPSQLTGIDPETVVTGAEEQAQVRGRALVVRRLKPLPIEAVARGYLIGSGWKDYQATGAVCGIALPPGLQMAQQLPAPLFTPATKAEAGDHDENIDYATVEKMLGADLAKTVRDTTLRLYREAATYARVVGIIIADTKFEFGQDEEGRLYLIDEVLTPDSSRFWPADRYKVGISPPSFDKQFVRDYLETLDWNKRAPGPKLPQDIIDKTAANYREALTRLAGPHAIGFTHRVSSDERSCRRAARAVRRGCQPAKRNLWHARHRPRLRREHNSCGSAQGAPDRVCRAAAVAWPGLGRPPAAACGQPVLRRRHRRDRCRDTGGDGEHGLSVRRRHYRFSAGRADAPGRPL
ncbi:MAG: phosphoribosylaminoimidazolesuccinocarboxamide synthase [Rhodocyclaceae bacterium]|nr:MAG: phosphoribosylaminoimidazolesuccinocarboxamide synthase [Rhodocyclaceae bacterium]